MFKWWIPLSTVDNAELVFIISIVIIRWIGLSLRLNNRSPVMRQGVSYKRLKTMKMLKLSPQCKEWSQSTSYERPGGQGGSWVNFAGYMPLTKGPGAGGGGGVVLGLILLGMCSWPLRAPTLSPLPHWPITKEIQFLYRRFNPRGPTHIF